MEKLRVDSEELKQLIMSDKYSVRLWSDLLIDVIKIPADKLSDFVNHVLSGNTHGRHYTISFNDSKTILYLDNYDYKGE